MFGNLVEMSNMSYNSVFPKRKSHAGFVLSSLCAALLLAFALSANAVAQEGDSRALDTVVVTASGHEQNIADAPASISVITSEELEKRSYTDVVDAVKDIPGVFVTGGGSAQDISIRGQSAGYTLFLVDGRPLSAGRNVNTNGQDGGKQIGLPPLSMIERIEVVRGPMSSLYGSEAMGGVVNIITRKVGDGWRGQVDTEFTKSFNDISEDGRSLNLFAAGPLVPEVLGIRLNGVYTGFDESKFVGGDDNAESRPESRRRQGGAELVLTPNKDHTFGLSVQSARQETTHTPGKSIAVDGVESYYRYDKDVYALTHEGRFGDFMVSTYLQQDISEREQELTKKETVTTLNSQGTYVWGEHILTFGFQYKTEKFTNETNGLWTSNVPGAVKTADRWLGAIFTEADWQLTEKFTLTTGVRFDKDEFFGSHVSPRLYGVYRHTPQWTLKGGISTGYKQPTLAQATAGIGSTTGGSTAGVVPPLTHSRGLILGNPDLEPEKSTNFEFGAAYLSPDRNLDASLMLFHTNFKDKIQEQRDCQGDTADRNNQANWNCHFGGRDYWFLSSMQNVNEAVMQGAEVTLDYRIAPSLRLSSSYTLTRTEQKSGVFKGEPLNKQPRHMFNAMLDWQIDPRWSVWVQHYYRGRTSDFLNRTTTSEGTPGYSLFNMGMVYTLSDTARVKAGLYNVANKKITSDTYGVVLDGLRMTMGLTVDF